MKSLSATETVAASIGRRGQSRNLILGAAILHILVVSLVFAVGKSRLMPGQFNEQGLGTFASDGFLYQAETVELCEVLRTQGVTAWATWPTQFDVRLYSIPLSAVYRCAGFTMLAIEPLNLVYY